MWEQIRSNQIRSVVLTIGMGALLVLIGYFLGLYFFNSAIAGLVIAVLLWSVLSLFAYFQGDSLLLTMSRARKIKPMPFPHTFDGPAWLKNTAKKIRFVRRNSKSGKSGG